MTCLLFFSVLPHFWEFHFTFMCKRLTKDGLPLLYLTDTQNESFFGGLLDNVVA